MTSFHICYMIGHNLCTGKTIKALSYQDALRKFGKGRNILYICRL